MYRYGKAGWIPNLLHFPIVLCYLIVPEAERVVVECEFVNDLRIFKERRRPMLLVPVKPALAKLGKLAAARAPAPSLIASRREKSFIVRLLLLVVSNF